MSRLVFFPTLRVSAKISEMLVIKLKIFTRSLGSSPTSRGSPGHGGSSSPLDWWGPNGWSVNQMVSWGPHGPTRGSHFWHQVCGGNLFLSDPRRHPVGPQGTEVPPLHSIGAEVLRPEGMISQPDGVLRPARSDERIPLLTPSLWWKSVNW